VRSTITRWYGLNRRSLGKRWFDLCRPIFKPGRLDAYEFVFESRAIKPGPGLPSTHPSPSRLPRPLTEALLDLTGRIHKDFPIRFKGNQRADLARGCASSRAGRLQDFAHLQIACLRSLGLPARYVRDTSNLIRHLGAPADGCGCSHAAVFGCLLFVLPQAPVGWTWTPPNNIVPHESHVTLSWGRDYGDVSPVRGVILGRPQTMKSR